MVISVRTEAGPQGLEVVKTADNDRDRLRLVEEATLLRRGAGPGVVAIIASTVDELRLQYSGAPLHQVLPLPTDHGVAVVCAVADVVDRLHEAGVAHGRIAAEHILLDDAGRPQLSGFGQATLVDGRSDPAAAEDVAALGALLDRVLDAGQERAWSPAHAGARHRTRRKQAKDDLRRVAAMAQRIDPAQRITAHQLATAIRDSLSPLDLPAADADPGTDSTDPLPDPVQPFDGDAFDALHPDDPGAPIRSGAPAISPPDDAEVDRLDDSGWPDAGEWMTDDEADDDWPEAAPVTETARARDTEAPTAAPTARVPDPEPQTEPQAAPEPEPEPEDPRRPTGPPRIELPPPGGARRRRRRSEMPDPGHDDDQPSPSGAANEAARATDPHRPLSDDRAPEPPASDRPLADRPIADRPAATSDATSPPPDPTPATGPRRSFDWQPPASAPAPASAGPSVGSSTRRPGGTPERSETAPEPRTVEPPAMAPSIAPSAEPPPTRTPTTSAPTTAAASTPGEDGARPRRRPTGDAVEATTETPSQTPSKTASDAADDDREPGPSATRWILPGVLILAGIVLAVLAAQVLFGSDDGDGDDGDTAASVTELPPAELGTAEAWPAECDLPAITGPDMNDDGCPEPIQLTGRDAVVGGVQVSFGSDGDVLAVADVNCDGIVTPFLLRPATGEIFQWDAWATEETIDVDETTQIQGATGFTMYEGECDVVTVDVGDDQIVVGGR